MYKIVFSVKDILDDFFYYAHSHNIPYDKVRRIVPKILDDDFKLFVHSIRKREGAIDRRIRIFTCSCKEDGEVQWVLPPDRFVSGIVSEYISEIKNIPC